MWYGHGRTGRTGGYGLVVTVRGRKRDTQTDRHREIDLLGGRVGAGQGGRRMF